MAIITAATAAKIEVTGQLLTIRRQLQEIRSSIVFAEHHVPIIDQMTSNLAEMVNDILDPPTISAEEA